MFAWIRDWLIWLDGQIKNNRPRRRLPQPPPKTIFEPITPDELRQLGKKIGVDQKYVEKLIDDHEFPDTGFEFGGHWFRIVGSHFNDKKHH